MTLDRLTSALADRYTIERELGQGGMATVYLAQDLKHDRKVAIKVLRPELAAAIGAERFLAEIKTTANLRHPHILPLYDSGEAKVPPRSEGERGTGGEGFLYYVMPLVEGESLRDRLNREKQLPIDQALAIAREVADALGYAHQRGDMYAVAVGTGAQFEHGAPHLLFSRPGMSLQEYYRSYDVHPDGKRFLMLSSGEIESRRLSVILNWRPDLQGSKEAPR